MDKPLRRRRVTVIGGFFCTIRVPRPRLGAFRGVSAGRRSLAFDCRATSHAGIFSGRRKLTDTHVFRINRQPVNRST